MKVIARNRRAKFDYEIASKLLVGIVLTGAEVKSVKQGHVSLKGSFVTINQGELWLINSHISPYQPANLKNYQPTRSRKLLVHKKELKELAGQKQSGRSIVPIAIGLEHGFIKVEIGVGRGLKKYDKREVKKKRQAERQINRRLSSRS